LKREDENHLPFFCSLTAPNFHLAKRKRGGQEFLAGSLANQKPAKKIKKGEVMEEYPKVFNGNFVFPYFDIDREIQRVFFSYIENVREKIALRWLKENVVFDDEVDYLEYCIKGNSYLLEKNKLYCVKGFLLENRAIPPSHNYQTYHSYSLYKVITVPEDRGLAIEILDEHISGGRCSESCYHIRFLGNKEDWKIILSRAGEELLEAKGFRPFLTQVDYKRYLVWLQEKAKKSLQL